MTLVGVPYAHGGADGQGLDCSGLVFRVFRDTADLELPRGVAGLMGAGVPGKSPIHIGDLLFFDTTEKRSPSQPTHVGIYAGDDRFVHAASEGPRTGVTVSNLSAAYYRDRFLGARRVIPWRSPELHITLTDETSASDQVSPFASRENLKLVVASRMTGGGPVELRVYKNDREVLMRRIVPPRRGRPKYRSSPTGESGRCASAGCTGAGSSLRVGFTVEE